MSSTSLIDDDHVAPKKWKPKPSIIVLMVINFSQALAVFGMGAIKPLFMKDFLHLSEETSVVLINITLFVQGVLNPIGGWLSDRFLGSFKTQIYGNIIWCVGSGAMAFSTFLSTTHGSAQYPIALATGLGGMFLVHAGRGFMGAVSIVFIGDQYELPREAEDQKRSFSWMYFWADAGFLVGVFSMPIIRQSISYRVSMLVLCGVTVGFTLLFLFGSATYRKITPNKSRLDSQCCTLPPPEDRQVLRKICKVFVPIIFFWALWQQQYSTLVFQATQMNTRIGSWHVPPDIMNTFNGIIVLLALPLFDRVVYPLCARRLRYPLLPLRRFVMGMGSITIAFGLATIVQWQLSIGNKLSIAAQLPLSAFISIGEVFVAVTGLEFGYNESNAGLRNTISSFWQLTIALGPAVVAGITLVYTGSQVWYFFIFTAIGIATTAVLAVISWTYKYSAFYRAEVIEKRTSGPAVGVALEMETAELEAEVETPLINK